MNQDSPFETWRLENLKQVAVSPEIFELLALAFEGGRSSKREWRGLTDEDKTKAWAWAQKSSKYGVTRIDTFAHDIEARLREKNT